MPFNELQFLSLRGIEPLTFDEPKVYFCVGVRDSAKSTLLETLAEYYLDQGSCVADIYAARDGENLAWCRSEWAKERKVLLLHGENVDVIAPFKTKKVDDVTLHDFDVYDLIISCPLLYLKPDDEFLGVNHVIDILYRRPPSWKRMIYALVRESANLFYSRLRISPNQLTAKSEIAYLTREMRHQGVSLGLDTQQMTAVDYQVRTQSDYTFVKRMGVVGIIRDDPLYFLYSYFRPEYIRRMPKNEFIMACKGGALALGSFEKLEWHKRPREDILAKTGIHVEYGEVREPLKGSTEGEVGDEEHSRLIEAYVKEKLSMGKISEKMGRSPATVLKHINQHNEAIERSGFCPRCKKINSIYFLQRAMKT